MPVPEKKDGESTKEFLHRCMGDEIMKKEFPDLDQRYAVCNSKLIKNKGSEDTKPS